MAIAWPYQIYPAKHPITSNSLDTILDKLRRPGTGIRRWETDQWYGGEEWPELTDWLSYLEIDRDRLESAKYLHGLNTQRALTTQSLQIGEVFDSKQKRFTSAFPLGWPEAQYVLTSLKLAKALSR
jgi:GH15 family glucan-1,4-alpha-glucosidase